MGVDWTALEEAIRKSALRQAKEIIDNHPGHVFYAVALDGVSTEPAARMELPVLALNSEQALRRDLRLDAPVHDEEPEPAGDPEPAEDTRGGFSEDGSDFQSELHDVVVSGAEDIILHEAEPEAEVEAPRKETRTLPRPRRTPNPWMTCWARTSGRSPRRTEATSTRPAGTRRSGTGVPWSCSTSPLPSSGARRSPPSPAGTDGRRPSAATTGCWSPSPSTWAANWPWDELEPDRLRLRRGPRGPVAAGLPDAGTAGHAFPRPRRLAGGPAPFLIPRLGAPARGIPVAAVPGGGDNGDMEAHTHLEIERKYDVGGSVPVPDLAAVPGVATAVEFPPVELRADYFDTGGGTLGERKITLRRRLGGPDEGWHIKSTAIGGRMETHFPLGGQEANVPEAVLDVVRVHTRADPLRPVARVRTQRTVVRLLSGVGALLAEFCDDEVRARAVGGAELAWREWEVELGPAGTADLLDGVEAVLLKAGAAPSTHVSKLRRVLDAAGPGPRPAPRPRTGAQRRRPGTRPPEAQPKEPRPEEPRAQGTRARRNRPRSTQHRGTQRRRRPDGGVPGRAGDAQALGPAGSPRRGGRRAPDAHRRPYPAQPAAHVRRPVCPRGLRAAGGRAAPVGQGAGGCPRRRGGARPGRPTVPGGARRASRPR